MKYENDKRMVSMADIEEILVANYGEGDYDRKAGCSINGNWLSVDNVLACIASEA